jgi:hypothetical protein
VSQGENAEHSGELIAERSASPGPPLELNDSATNQASRGAVGWQQEQPYGGEVQFEPGYEAYSPAVPVEQQHSVEATDVFQVAHDAADHTATSGGAGPQAARPSRFSLQPIHEEEEFTPDRPGGPERHTLMPQAYSSSEEPLNLKLAP